MTEFLQSYDILIFIGVLFGLMMLSHFHRGGVGCCGVGHAGNR